MSYYGFTVTKNGRDLIAKLVAGEQLELSRIMVGSGQCPDDEDPKLLNDLIQPVAVGTSTTPTYEEAAVKMIVEYRSDLNGGLDHGFWLNEFGVYAFDPDEGEVLIYYGCLGDYPQWVSAASATGVDVRRFPVLIYIGEDSGVTVDYSCEAWMTAEDVAEFCSVTVLPMFLSEASQLIVAHDSEGGAHQLIQNCITDVDARVSLLELLLATQVTGNPFTVMFNTLDGLSVSGVWNDVAKRIEF